MLFHLGFSRLTLTLSPRLASTSRQSSCLGLPNAETAGTCHPTWFLLACFCFLLTHSSCTNIQGYSLTFQQHMDTVQNDQFRMTNISVTSDKGQLLLWRSFRILCVSRFGILRDRGQPLLYQSSTERLKVIAYPTVGTSLPILSSFLPLPSQVPLTTVLLSVSVRATL